MSITSSSSMRKRSKSFDIITRESSTSPISNNSTINSDYENDNYVIKANVCKSLSREFNLPEMKCDATEYIPPSTHGLINSEIIIPSYYNLHKDPINALNVDYYKMIKDDIRNFRPLNKFQLEYIKQLDHPEKNELFDIFTLCLNTFSSLIL